MFGIGFTEILVVGVVALVFVGPTKLPELMKQFGKFFVQARRMTSEVRSTVDTVIREAENELQKEELDKVRSILENAKNEAEEAAKKIIDVEPYEGSGNHGKDVAQIESGDPSHHHHHNENGDHPHYNEDGDHPHHHHDHFESAEKAAAEMDQNHSEEAADNGSIDKQKKEEKPT